MGNYFFLQNHLTLSCHKAGRDAPDAAQISCSELVNAQNEFRGQGQMCQAQSKAGKVMFRGEETIFQIDITGRIQGSQGRYRNCLQDHRQL